MQTVYCVVYLGMTKYEKQTARFGKYKGKLVSWIVENDKPYAEWLAYTSNSSTQTKRAAQSQLDKIQENEKTRTA